MLPVKGSRFVAWLSPLQALLTDRKKKMMIYDKRAIPAMHKNLGNDLPIITGLCTKKLQCILQLRS